MNKTLIFVGLGVAGLLYYLHSKSAATLAAGHVAAVNAQSVPYQPNAADLAGASIITAAAGSLNNFISGL